MIDSCLGEQVMIQQTMVAWSWMFSVGNNGNEGGMMTNLV